MSAWKSLSIGWFSVLLLALSACGSGSRGVVAAAAEPEGPAAFRAVLESVYETDAPGATVVISREGEVIYSGAFGLADLEMGVPLTEEHIFRLASVTKQYTAAGILSLVEAGKFSLDDPLRHFLPDFPIGDATIHQLLNHTSGIVSFTNIPGYRTDERMRRDVSTEELIAVFAEEAAEFPPGEGYRYNNSGYMLLGAIIEQVTGKSWNAYIEDELLRPAGIERTGYYTDSQILPGRARGHIKGDPPTNAPWISMTQPHAAGAFSATARDVDRWQRALHRGEIISADMLEKMYQPAGAASAAGYGYGLTLGNLRGRPMLRHGGGVEGFNTYALWLPNEQLSVVVLSNYAGSGPGEAAQRLAALAVDDPFPIEMPGLQARPEILDSIAGIYHVEGDASRSLRVINDEIVIQSQNGPEFKVRPVTDERFVIVGTLDYFDIERDVGGRVTGLHFFQAQESGSEYAGKISAVVAEKRGD